MALWHQGREGGQVLASRTSFLPRRQRRGQVSNDSNSRHVRPVGVEPAAYAVGQVLEVELTFGLRVEKHKATVQSISADGTVNVSLLPKYLGYEDLVVL